MTKPRITLLLAAAVSAFAFTGAAGAAGIGDLPGQGYTVSISNPGPDGQNCPTYYISAPWIGTYANACDPGFQATIDNLADPTLNYERAWQAAHGDQLDAATHLVAECYAVNRIAPMTDSWSVTGGPTADIVPGAALPGLAASLPDLHVNGSCAANTPTSQTTPNTDEGGSVSAPGQLPSIDPTTGAVVTPGVKVGAVGPLGLASASSVYTYQSGTGTVTVSTMDSVRYRIVVKSDAGPSHTFFVF